MSPSYAAAVSALLAAGWPAALPLPRGQKWPPPSGWTGRTAPWPDAEQHERWTRDQPGGNLALRLPGDVLGIDVDWYKPEARQSLARLIEKCGTAPRTWIITSRVDSSGIRLYRTPIDMRWAERYAGPGIELLHSGHRYAVAPPSVHPEGREYRWIAPNGGITNRAPCPDELPPLPPAWIAHLTVRPTPACANHGGRSTGASEPIRAGSNYAGATIAATLADLRSMRAGDGRNAALNRAAYKLGGLVGAGLLDEQEVRAALVEAARVNSYETKVGSKRVEDIIDSGLSAGIARPRVGAGQ